MHKKVRLLLNRLLKFRKYERRVLDGVPIRLRRGTADAEVYDYVFVEKYHRPEFPLTSVRPMILDLGSNVGFSIIDLKQCYPNAKIYGFELDRDNFDLCASNCSSLRDVEVLNIGIWSDCGSVTYSKESGSDAYSISTSPNTSTRSASSEVVTIDEIIKRKGIEIIDYVKMDIEGAELAIFRANLDWAKIVKQIKVEVHYGETEFRFIEERMKECGFLTRKDSLHWSTIIGVRNSDAS